MDEFRGLASGSSNDTRDEDFVLLEQEDIRDFNSENLIPLSGNEISQIQTWLQPTDYAAISSERGKHQNSHVSGTGDWILNTDQYKQWHDSHSGGLWIKAVAGVGKSVIAATLVSNLATTERVPVLYFFFRHIISANQTPISLTRDLLSQVLQYSPHLQHELFNLVDKKRRALDTLSLEELWDMLISTLGRLPRVYCVIDALDEMDFGNETFLDNLVNLAEKQPTSIKVLLTSRPIPRIERRLRNTSLLQLVLASQLINPDISKYVLHRVKNHSMPPHTASRIHVAMCEKANGHFLYARLMMDDLLHPSKHNLSDSQRLAVALEKLPTPLADMYTQMLLEHSQRSKVPQDLQVAILYWVTRAERPLRLLELSAMIDIKHLLPEATKDAKSLIREACGPLLEIFEDETVHPIHHSLTEYLYDETRSGRRSDSSTFPVLYDDVAQRFLAMTCLARLASGWHQEWFKAPAASPSAQPIAEISDESSNPDIESRNTINLKYPYLEYASQNWDNHLRKSRAKDDEVVRALRRVLTQDLVLLQALVIWLQERDIELDEFETEPSSTAKPWSPLHLAADKGLSHFVELLLQEGHDMEQLTVTEHTPLALAARNGHHDVVKTLLKYGSRNNQSDDVGFTPLHLAARANHWEVVKTLLEAGVDPLTPKTKEYPGRWCGNAPTSIGDTPVEYACSFGHLETMRVMLPFLKGEKLQEALYWALRFGRSQIALEVAQCPDIDVNHYFKNQTPLYLAARSRDIEVMRLLLQKGADPHLLSCSYFGHGGVMPGGRELGRHSSPLHVFAVRTDHEHLPHLNETKFGTLVQGFSLLLAAGIDPNVIDSRGSTVLHAIAGLDVMQSSSKFNTDLMKPVLAYLFMEGLSAAALTKDGSNALHLLSRAPPTVVDLLISEGVDIDTARPSDGKTPLMTAAYHNNERVVERLLMKGANANVTDHDGNTLLHICSQSSAKIDMVKVFIAAGVDVNARNNDGDTALHLGGWRPELTSLFLDHGFDLDTKNRLGHTLLLHSASRWGEFNAYKNLLALGSDVMAWDNQGATILHILLRNIRGTGATTTSAFRYFVENGVNPRSTDVLGNNLWHVMAGVDASYAKLEQFAVMELLQEHGVSPTARNLQGQTPLHIAFSLDRHAQYDYEVIERLLEYTGQDVNVSDCDQIQPLHQTASFHAVTTCLLLQHGANYLARTKEGQTPLMIACRTRQCNVVCILLHHYRKNDVLHLIDQTDKSGRTALHYACRSGRPETVALLLEAGACVNSKDKSNATPLHVCAGFVDEDLTWQRYLESGTEDRKLRARYVLSSDFTRNRDPTNAPGPVRIRETIRLLIQYGADTSFLTEMEGLEPVWRMPGSSALNDGRTEIPLVMAINSGCGAMVSELLLIQSKLLVTQEIGPKFTPHPTEQDAASKPTNIRAGWLARIGQYRNQIKLLRMHHMPGIIASSVKQEQNDSSLVWDLLQEDNEPGVRQMAELGTCFNLLDNGAQSTSRLLAQWGFADLLHDLGKDTFDMTVALTKEMSSQNVNQSESRLHNLFYAAVNRATPNMAVVKLLVSVFQHDVNEMFANGTYEPVMHTYAHCLARPTHWWQTLALEYLLKNGAHIELPNSTGETPLIVALRPSYSNHYDPARVRAVEILLQYGANPNAMDSDGLTCLNIAIQQPRYVELLLRHGADPLRGSRPFLHDAIQIQDVPLIKRIIASGANVNRLPQLFDQPQDKVLSAPARRSRDPYQYAHKDVHKWAEASLKTLTLHAYPLHVAASRFFNVPGKSDKAREIIDLLLKGGADPCLVYDDGSSILHCLARHNGIIEPFLDLESIDIEMRDGIGRTPLLAACDAEHTKTIGNKSSLAENDAIQTLLDHGASPTAVDNDGRNMLHYLISNTQASNPLWRKIETILGPLLPSLASSADATCRTPFHCAIAWCFVEFVSLLLDRGIDASISDPIDGTTALHHLATTLVQSDNFQILDDSDGDTLARFATSPDRWSRGVKSASTMSAEEILEIQRRSTRRLFTSLLAHDLSINHRDSRGETPMFKLAETGATTAGYISLDNDAKTGIGRLLSSFLFLDKVGADVTMRNHAGESVLHKLAKHRDSLRSHGIWGRECQDRDDDLRETFKWLITKGVDVTWEDDRQRTCLDIAAVSGATWVTKMYERE